MTRPLSKTKALLLWDTLRDGMVNVEKTLVKIIETRAWEPLGYETFSEAWAERMEGVRLATAMGKANVVYAMLRDGMDPSEVQVALGYRIGEETVRLLKKQHDAGVPANLARTTVRRHTRARPSEPKILRVELSNDELHAFRGIADSRGLDLQREAAKAIRTHFRRLEKLK